MHPPPVVRLAGAARTSLRSYPSCWLMTLAVCVVALVAAALRLALGHPSP